MSRGHNYLQKLDNKPHNLILLNIVTLNILRPFFLMVIFKYQQKFLIQNKSLHHRVQESGPNVHIWQKSPNLKLEEVHCLVEMHWVKVLVEVHCLVEVHWVKVLVEVHCLVEVHWVKVLVEMHWVKVLVEVHWVKVWRRCTELKSWWRCTDLKSGGGALS